MQWQRAHRYICYCSGSISYPKMWQHDCLFYLYPHLYSKQFWQNSTTYNQGECWRNKWMNQRLKLPSMKVPPMPMPISRDQVFLVIVKAVKSMRLEFYECIISLYCYTLTYDTEWRIKLDYICVLFGSVTLHTTDS